MIVAIAASINAKRYLIFSFFCILDSLELDFEVVKLPT
jgi:hypothetical protein